MLVLILALWIVSQGVTIGVLFWAVRSFGQFAASNALLHAQVVQALAEIAKIRASDRKYDEPSPAPFTSDESAA